MSISTFLKNMFEMLFEKAYAESSTSSHHECINKSETLFSTDNLILVL